MADAYRQYIARRREEESLGIERDDSERTMDIHGRLNTLDTNSYQTVSTSTPIGTDNKGLQMLLKMGWKSGTGLGRTGQGRLEPINVREKHDCIGIGRETFEEDKAAETTSDRVLTDAEKEVVMPAEKVEALRRQWKDKADKAESIDANIKAAIAVFYCEICDKQYHKVSEFDNHMSSYDHLHTRRRKEAAARDRQLKMKKGSKRDKKESEKEMKRINKLAAAAVGTRIKPIHAPALGGWANSANGQPATIVRGGTADAPGGWGAVGAASSTEAPLPASVAASNRWTNSDSPTVNAATSTAVSTGSGGGTKRVMTGFTAGAPVPATGDTEQYASLSYDTGALDTELSKTNCSEPEHDSRANERASYLAQALADWLEDNPGVDHRSSEAWAAERAIAEKDFDAIASQVSTEHLSKPSKLSGIPPLPPGQSPQPSESASVYLKSANSMEAHTSTLIAAPPRQAPSSNKQLCATPSAFGDSSESDEDVPEVTKRQKHGSIWKPS